MNNNIFLKSIKFPFSKKKNNSMENCGWNLLSSLIDINNDYSERHVCTKFSSYMGSESKLA